MEQVLKEAGLPNAIRAGSGSLGACREGRPEQARAGQARREGAIDRAARDTRHCVGCGTRHATLRPTRLMQDRGEGLVPGGGGADGAEEARRVGVGGEEAPAYGRHLGPRHSTQDARRHA